MLLSTAEDLAKFVDELKRAGVSGKHAARFKPKDAVLQLLERV